jgi:hypothetical protein
LAIGHPARDVLWGYLRSGVVDDVPLACDPDTVSNLRWQTIRDARAKDRGEREGRNVRNNDPSLIEPVAVNEPA